ncbi:MAG: hypothetical protein LBE22_10330 [Azoarcus sp.]|jgi:hypothetical protein|nr:hypothetical protein [Azoarcus sp.]
MSRFIYNDTGTPRTARRLIYNDVGTLRTAKRLLHNDGTNVREVIFDPYWNETVLLIEGSAVDQSRYEHTITPVGGADFISGVASGITFGKHFEVNDKGHLYIQSNQDFTIEFASEFSDNIVGFSVVFAGKNWANNVGWIAASGSAVVLRTNAGGFHNSQMLQGMHEYAFMRRGGNLYAFFDGVQYGGSVSGNTTIFDFGSNGGSFIGATPQGSALQNTPFNFRRLRVTRAARYIGNYTVPERY